MPRSNPARSDYCATRHLLRNLGDSAALRRNPLVSNIPESEDARAMASVSSAVSRALSAMDAATTAERWRTVRHTAILLRIDVARESHAVVANDLGLSERQLRRERRVAHRRFLAALQEGAGSPALVRERTADVQIALAERLADSGEPRSALAILDDIAVRAPDPAARCRALMRSADVETDLHRLGAASRRLHDAAGLMHAAIVPQDKQHGLAREHRVSALQVAWFEAGPSAIVPEAQRVQEPDDARMWMLRACAALRAGDGRRARLLSQRAREALRPVDGDGIRVDLEILDAELADFLDANSAEAQRRFQRAIDLAGDLGYGGRSLWATHLLAFTRWLHGGKAAERAAYRALVDRVDGSMPEQHRLMLYFSAADIELAIGNPRRAVTASRHALHLATNVYERLSAQALEAGALLRIGQIQPAESAARATAEEARRQGYLRIVSTAQRLASEAALERGERRIARERIEDALACAVGRTSAYVLALTYDVAARITRDRRHAVLARDLRGRKEANV
jgi:hypothetical protein